MLWRCKWKFFYQISNVMGREKQFFTGNRVTSIIIAAKKVE